MKLFAPHILPHDLYFITANEDNTANEEEKNADTKKNLHTDRQI